LSSINILSFGIFRVFSMTVTLLTLYWAFYATFKKNIWQI
jgi:hypothetical protein